MDTTFNQEFFDEMLNESIKEEINKKSAEKVLSKLSKTALGKLFLLDGKEFYIELLTCIGFIRITHLKDKNLNKAIDELKASTGLDGEDLEEYIRTHGVDCEMSSGNRMCAIARRQISRNRGNGRRNKHHGWLCKELVWKNVAMKIIRANHSGGWIVRIWVAVMTDFST